MEDNSDNIGLKRRTLSQTGRLLSNLRIYDQALGYVEKSVELGVSMKDTLATVYNLELAGGIATRLEDYDKAKGYFEKACQLSKDRYPSEYAINKFRVGYTTLSCGDTLTALNMMRSSISEISDMDKNFVLPAAARTYLDIGLLDTAYMYSKLLIDNSDSLNKGIGYKIMLSELIKDRVNPDTILVYVEKYKGIVDGLLDKIQDDAALMQNAMYNYSLHDRARQNMERERDRMQMWLMLSIIIVLVVGILFCVYVVRKEKANNKFFKIISRIRTSKRDKGSKGIKSGASGNKVSDKTEDNLKEELIRIYERSASESDRHSIPEAIILSTTYKEIRSNLDKQNSIENRKDFWIEIERIVEECYPDFIKRIHILTGGEISYQEVQTVLLIKCGFRVKDIAILLGKTHSTIGSRRESISLKIFGESKGLKWIDKFIRTM